MILTLVFGIFTLVATSCRKYGLKAKGMAVVWLMVSLVYLTYLHGAWYAPSLFKRLKVIFFLIMELWFLTHSSIWVQRLIHLVYSFS